MYFTPHSTSAMAMFGYVYMWYLMAVLVFEICSTIGARSCCFAVEHGPAAIDLQGNDARLDQHQRALAGHRRTGGLDRHFDRHSLRFLLHGYVGFIFGSIRPIPGGRRR